MPLRIIRQEMRGDKKGQSDSGPGILGDPYKRARNLVAFSSVACTALANQTAARTIHEMCGHEEEEEDGNKRQMVDPLVLMAAAAFVLIEVVDTDDD